MSTDKRVLLYTSSIEDYIKSWSDTQDYQDGLSNIKKEYNIIDDSCTDNYVVELVSDWNEVDMYTIFGEFAQIQDVVITGTLGMWHGTRTIEPIREDRLDSAFNRCADNMNKVELYYNNGIIEIDAYHHDGCNHFSIYQLNSKGVNAGDRADLTKHIYHKKITLY